VSAPAVTNTYFLPGQIVRSEFDCFYGTTNHFTNAVTYTPRVRFDPPLPAGPLTTPGEYQFEVYVDGLSSTNACPDLTAHAGTLRVFVSKVTLALGTTNVFVNADDDNGNATNDVNEALSGPDSEVAGENDLVSLSLGIQGVAPGQTVTLGVSGKVRIWLNSTRGPGAPVLDTVNGANSITWAASAMPGTLWIEGVTPSTALNDVALSLSVDPPGCSVMTNLTVFHLAIVADNNRNGMIMLDGSDWTSPTNRFFFG